MNVTPVQCTEDGLSEWFWIEMGKTGIYSIAPANWH